MRPEDVLHVEFSTQPRGFNQDEVRAHLQQVAVALRDAQEKAVEAEGTAHDVMGDLQQALEQLRAYEGVDQGPARRDQTEQIPRVHPGERGAPGADDAGQVSGLQQRVVQLERELREAHARVEHAEVRAKQAETMASEAVESEQLLKRTLVMAQRTADAAIAEARAESSRLRTEAADAAQHVRQEADEYAARVTSEAEERAARVTREADSAAKQTTEDAKAEAERVTAEANTAAQEARDLAHDDAAKMRAIANAVREEVTAQARTIAQLRRTYAAQARAAIEDHVAAFSELAHLPDLPEELAAQADTYVDSSGRSPHDREQSLNEAVGSGSSPSQEEQESSDD
ncbi:DivIVA domain-containing protein [Stomatohabitans albus]|uniref:DivIVA domain-containing protein n=1 Tax=Stomatohabitans albus TaxID=3110766 RepID=UPI00300C97A2